MAWKIRGFELSHAKENIKRVVVAKRQDDRRKSRFGDGTVELEDPRTRGEGDTSQLVRDQPSHRAVWSTVKND